MSSLDKILAGEDVRDVVSEANPRAGDKLGDDKAFKGAGWYLFDQTDKVLVKGPIKTKEAADEELAKVDEASRKATVVIQLNAEGMVG